MKLQELIEESLGDFIPLVRSYCELHTHPELSFAEWRSAEHISTFLSEAGIEVRTIAGTGVLATIRGEQPEEGSVRRAVVLRADMDALPITESPDAQVRSENEGVMHACGHDLHSVALLGALLLINRHRAEFAGTLFGLFQPGEELNPGGASMVLAENPFEGYSVVAFVGQHCEPALPTGTFGFRSGRYMASSDELRFTVRGQGGHAALREGVVDPVPAAAKFIGLLHAIPNSSPDKSLTTIISIGRVEANGATNVVPNEVYMEGTMRAFDEAWRAEIKRLVANAARAIEKEFGVEIDVNISDGYPCVDNDEELTERVAGLARKLFGEQEVVNLGLRPTAEDFGFYTCRYPSLFYRLGVGGDGDFFRDGKAGRLHTPHFAPDRRAIGFGSVMFAAVLFDLLGKGLE